MLLQISYMVKILSESIILSFLSKDVCGIHKAELCNICVGHVLGE
jgi:hypothetical protein